MYFSHWNAQKHFFQKNSVGHAKCQAQNWYPLEGNTVKALFMVGLSKEIWKCDVRRAIRFICKLLLWWTFNLCLRITILFHAIISIRRNLGKRCWKTKKRDWKQRRTRTWARAWASSKQIAYLRKEVKNTYETKVDNNWVMFLYHIINIWTNFGHNFKLFILFCNRYNLYLQVRWS